MLLGHRSYLVVRQPARGKEILNFRMNRIQEAQVLNKSFQLAPSFSLANYMAMAFWCLSQSQTIRQSRIALHTCCRRAHSRIPFSPNPNHRAAGRRQPDRHVRGSGLARNSMAIFSMGRQSGSLSAHRLARIGCRSPKVRFRRFAMTMLNRN